ncbi:ABC transporter H family member 2, partial [Diaphorina citri]|uniref:ABC transporter H family member 2 n=1 Tax=Diaphorina citri TaxID=121845 RepID=A0A3Q0JKE9_DIACI
RDNQQWVKLKTYILNRRNEEIQEKEKEEELAKKRKLLEEEYLKTKEELEKVQKEISDKNNILKQFADEKHELFLQLKKVLLDDDNRKRIESEKNEHTLLLNNLNHTSQAQIYISQAPLSNNIGQQAPINSSSIYKLPMTTATAIPPSYCGYGYTPVNQEHTKHRVTDNKINNNNNNNVSSHKKKNTTFYHLIEGRILPFITL